MSQDRSEETRRIYHEQHKRIAGDSTAMARFISMFSEKYFGVPQGFFAGKRCLDAGCGDTAKLLIALHRMGCRDLHGFDLGDDFMPVARQSLDAQGVGANAVQFKSGSVLSAPYPDASFDFVACHGVLVHLNDLDEVERAFADLARVTRSGGMLYTVYGLVGGFFEDCILPAVRDYYRRNAEFKRLIDDIQPQHFQQLAEAMRSGLLQHEGEKADLSFVPKLFDTDLSVFFQNAIQAPVRLVVDEAMIRRMYQRAGFGEPRRLRRYVRRANIRRYFAPLHYDRDGKFSRLLYGSGNLEFVAVKK
jgi:ubiquinone/menaquinone biosynthesis C-methylase UbiE